MKKGLIFGASALAALVATLLAKNKQNEKVRQTAIATRAPQKVMIVGATSAIAQETAKLFAARGDSLFLVARSAGKLQIIANDLSVRGASKVETATLDLNELSVHPQLLANATEVMDGLDIVLVAHGTLGDQDASQADFEVARQELKTNFLSVISLLTPLANQFEAQGHGTIAVISSVAGDRGRGSNYVYGTAKAGVTTFLSGLRNRLAKAGVQVLTIKPGFVDTPMTEHLDKGALFVGADVIAQGIVNAIDTKKDVVYLPWFWWGIMTVIRHIPESIFKKLSL